MLIASMLLHFGYIFIYIYLQDLFIQIIYIYLYLCTVEATVMNP